MNVQKQQGFTLVELIIVIVILGILAVTAAPRFLNFSGDAKASVLESVAGSIKAANSIVQGKATIAGLSSKALSCWDEGTQAVVAVQQSTPGTDDANESTVATTATICTTGDYDIAYGAMDSDEETLKGLVELADFTVADAATITTANGYAATAVLGVSIIAGNDTDAKSVNAAMTEGCFVKYTEATSSAAASIAVITNKCND